MLLIKIEGETERPCKKNNHYITILFNNKLKKKNYVPTMYLYKKSYIMLLIDFGRTTERPY